MTKLPYMVEEVVNRFARDLRERFGARWVGLRVFGSYARGEANEFSDVDLFVLLDGTDRPDRLAIYDAAGDLWEETGIQLSPTIMDVHQFEIWLQQERPLIMEIQREGISK